MSLAHEIAAAAATATGLPAAQCWHVLRSVREAGHWPTYTRKKSEQVVTDLELANYTAALMSGLPAGHAALAVERLAEARLSEADHRHAMQAPERFETYHPATVAFLEPRHSFLEGLAALFAVARGGPQAFEAHFKDSWVSVDPHRFSGRIVLTCEDFTPMPVRHLDFDLEYAPTEELFRGDLEVMAVLPASTIATLARTADRVTR